MKEVLTGSLHITYILYIIFILYLKTLENLVNINSKKRTITIENVQKTYKNRSQNVQISGGRKSQLVMIFTPQLKKIHSKNH